MEQISKWNEAIKKAEKKFASDNSVRSFEKSIADFEKMINDGIATPRGYNILSVENSFLTTQL